MVRLVVNYRRKTIKNTNIWRLNNMLLNNQQVTKEIKKEIKICIEANDNGEIITDNTPQQMAKDHKRLLSATVCQ